MGSKRPKQAVGINPGLTASASLSSPALLLSEGLDGSHAGSLSVRLELEGFHLSSLKQSFFSGYPHHGLELRS